MGKNKKYIALDYGTKKTGLAYSVEGISFAYRTIPTADLIGFLQKWIEEKGFEAVIVGLPLNIDGTESKHSARVRSFAKILEKELPLSVILHDERLSTSEAHFALEEVENPDIDAESARLILDDYLRESNESR